MNSALVLIVLLLAVPLQLFLSHYINSVYATSTATATSDNADSAISGGPSTSDLGGQESVKDIQSVRREALDRLSVGLTGMADYVQGTIQHYSKWRNWKELFLIPYRKEHKYKKRRSKTSGFTIERTVTLDKLGKTEAADSDPAVSSSTSKSSSAPPSKSSPVKHSISDQPPSSKDSKFLKDKKVPETTDKVNKGVKDEEYLYKNMYFAHSKTPRTSRPTHVKLRVGEVVKHKEQGYYGVIVGWDEHALAPEKWLRRYYTNRPHLRDGPHYLVLVDSHYDASGSPFHYIPQEHLELVQENIQIQAPEISQYFEGFRNHRHSPRPWLKQVYPED